MARSSERTQSPQPSVTAPHAPEEPAAPKTSAQPPSPTRSDKSSDSEGKPVREKLKDTRIDAQNVSEPLPTSDHAMDDVANGTEVTAEASTSGSESGRGRLRRKRSREDFEDETDKPRGKTNVLERHVRKKSRDVTSPEAPDVEAAAVLSTSAARLDEDGNTGDSSMVSETEPQTIRESVSNRPATPEPLSGDKDASTVMSPKNKRTLDQTQSEDNVTRAGTSDHPKNAPVSDKAGHERDAKRPRDTEAPTKPTESEEPKIPPISSFAKNSSPSPFSTLLPKPKTSSTTASTNRAEGLAQTADEKFKASGFGSFAASSSSPFGGIGPSSSNSSFAAPTSNGKLTSFASTTKSSTPSTSGFGALSSSATSSAFGGNATTATSGSVFGGSLGTSAFGGLGGSKSGLSSFATPGAQTITGLKQKAARPFGARGDAGNADDASDEDGDDEEEEHSTKDESEKVKSDNEQEKRNNFQPTEVETGEEGEDVLWLGRAKLYTMGGEGKDRGWQERGVGTLKLNITKDAPTKARFILRADATHRLLLNAAVTKTMVFGDTDGKEPSDGKLLFNTPTPDGKVDYNLLKMKAEKAVELWEQVERVKTLI